MSVIALGMNLFLAGLLLAALVMGWRLERRLRGVRESHAVFAKAVADLDQATARAQAGLADLRDATDEAIDLLGGRLTRAREAGDRLDKLLALTESMPARASEFLPERPVQQASEPRSRAEALAPTSLKGLLELAETARVSTGVAQLRQPVPTAPAPRARPRPIADDDLFDEAAA